MLLLVIFYPLTLTLFLAYKILLCSVIVRVEPYLSISLPYYNTIEVPLVKFAVLSLTSVMETFLNSHITKEKPK
jgi:hypothetical protein